MIKKNTITRNPFNRVTNPIQESFHEKQKSNRIRFYDRYWSAEILFLTDNNRFIDKQLNYIWFYEDGKIYNRSWKFCWWLENWVMRDGQWYTVAFENGANDWISPLFPIPWIPPHIWFIPMAPQKPIKHPWFQLKFRKYGWSALSPLTVFKNE